MNDEVIDDIIKKISLKKKRSWLGKQRMARKKYLTDKRNGVHPYMVDEWDEFERLRDETRIQEIIRKGENDMKFSVLVRLTKNYQVAEIGAEEIETPEDLEFAKNFCRTQAEDLLGSYVIETEDKPKQSPSTFTKSTFPQETGKALHPSALVTVDDITTKHGSRKQHGFLVDSINKGFTTLETVNNVRSYDDIKTLVGEYFDKNKR